MYIHIYAEHTSLEAALAMYRDVGCRRASSPRLRLIRTSTRSVPRGDTCCVGYKGMLLRVRQLYFHTTLLDFKTNLELRPLWQVLV